MDGKKLIELKQERATVTNSIRNIMTEFETVEMSAEKKEELGKNETRFDEINNLILREEKQLARERAIGEQANDTDDTKNKGKTDEIMNAFKEVIMNGSREAYEVYNALQQSNPTQAGYLVAPEQFVNTLIKTIDNSMFIRQKANVLPPLKGAQSLTRLVPHVWARLYGELRLRHQPPTLPWHSENASLKLTRQLLKS